MSLKPAARIVRRNLGAENPVLVQVLGICSALAVTNVLTNTLVMSAGVIFATSLSCLTVSALRSLIPPRVRLMVQVLVIAAWVIVVDILLKAVAPDVSRQLGPYVGLIITNCIVMGRTEAFAMSNRPLPALVDGASAGLGYAYVLCLIALVRELLGAGSVAGVRVLGPWWTNWSIMVMAPGAFFVLAVLVWVVKARLLPPPAAKGGRP